MLGPKSMGRGGILSGIELNGEDVNKALYMDLYRVLGERANLKG